MSMLQRPRSGAARQVLIAKLAFAGALLAWLLTSGRLDLGRIGELEFGFALAAGFALRGVSTLIPLFRWCVLARAAGLHISWRQGIQIGLAGRFFSLAAPGWLGMDSARVYYGVSRDPDQSEAVVASVLLDRISDIVALAGLAGAVFLWRMLDDIELAALAAPAALLFAVASVTSGSTVGRRLVRYIRSVMRVVGGYRTNRTPLLAAALIALAGHIVGFSGVWFLFQALAGEVTFVEVFTLQPIVALVRLVSISPHGLGVADVVGDVTYRSAGSPIGAEVVFVSRLITMAVSAVCGIGFLFPLARMRGRGD